MTSDPKHPINTRYEEHGTCIVRCVTVQIKHKPSIRPPWC